MDNKIVNWIIDLQGKPHDLEDCAELFKETEILVEREQSGGSIPRYYLHSSKFKGLADTQIHTVAGELMNELNSALKSRTGGGPVILGIPVTIRADGSRVPVKAVTAVSRMQTESLTAIHNVQGVPIESLAAVSHVEAVPIEHLTGVSNVGAMPIESLRSKVRRLWSINKYPFILYIIIQIAGLMPAFFPWNKVAFYYSLGVSLISAIVGVYAIERTSRIFTTTL